MITIHDTAENGNFGHLINAFVFFLNFGIVTTLNELIISNPKPKQPGYNVFNQSTHHCYLVMLY